MVGEILRDRREELGLDLDSIGETLRIKPSYLAALAPASPAPGTAAPRTPNMVSGLFATGPGATPPDSEANPVSTTPAPPQVDRTADKVEARPAPAAADTVVAPAADAPKPQLAS